MLDQPVSVSSNPASPRFRFEIFKFTREGHFIWIETAETLTGAIARASALYESGPNARYMVFREDTQQQIFVYEPIESEA